MEQRAKFRELRLAWTSREDAMKQAYWSVAPVPPTANPPINPPTPTATPPQTMQGVNGEIFQIAPVNPQTGLSAPTQPVVQPTQPVQPATPTPAPVTPSTTSVTPTVTPEVKQPKVEAPIDYTQAKGREQDILKNLESFKAQNMTPEQIMKASWYAEATPEKKALIEPYLKTTQPTVSGMFNAIIARQDIPDEQKTSIAFKIAQNRYTRANLYASMTPAQVSQAMTDVKLIEWSQAWDDLKLLNPKLVKDVENLRVVNGSKPNIFTYTNNPDGTPVKTNNLEKKFAEDYLGDYGEFLKSLFTVQTPEQIRAIIYTPDVQQAQEKATEIELRMNEIEKNMDAVDDDVDKEMAWSGATASRIALEKASRKEKFQNQYNAELKNYTTYANKANNLITQNTAAYQSSQTQRTAMNNALALAWGKIFENKMALEQSQAEFDQKIAQQAETMGTPELAIPSVINQYAEMGIMASKSAQQHIADAKAFIARGGTLGEYISQMQKDFQAKPAYLAKFGTQKDTKPFEVGKQTYQYNPTTGNYEVISPITAWTGGDLRYLASQFPWQAWAKNNNPAGITWNANFDNGTWTAALLKQAGINYSKGTARPANEGGNYVTFATIEDGLKAQQIIMSQTYGNSTVGQMLASWVWTGEWVNYAKQVAGMAWVDTNVKVSSLTPEQLSTLQMAKIKKESPWLYGILSQGTWGEDIKMQALSLVQWLGWTADERQAFADNVIKVAQRDNISLAEAKKKLGYKSADDTEFAKTRKEDIQSLKKDTRDKLSNANTALTLLNQPQTAIWDVASVVGFLKTIDPASVARESEVASVENARGILDSLSNVFAKAKEGTKLTDTQRTQLKQAIGTIVDAGNNKYYEAIYNTSQEFNDRGLDPTVYISKNDVTKANKLFSGNAEVKKNLVQMTKEKVINLYNKWKSNQK